jgi:hypothetical protein
VIVFVDYHNLYKGARESFHTPEVPGVNGHIHPLQLGEIIARQIPKGELAQMRVYRGIPSNQRDPRGYGAVRKQTAAWVKSSPEKIHVYTAPCSTCPGWPPARRASTCSSPSTSS